MSSFVAPIVNRRHTCTKVTVFDVLAIAVLVVVRTTAAILIHAIVPTGRGRVNGLIFIVTICTAGNRVDILAISVLIVIGTPITVLVDTVVPNLCCCCTIAGSRSLQSVPPEKVFVSSPSPSWS